MSKSLRRDLETDTGYRLGESVPSRKAWASENAFGDLFLQPRMRAELPRIVSRNAGTLSVSSAFECVTPAHTISKPTPG